MGLYEFFDNKRTFVILAVLAVALVLLSIFTMNVYRGVGLQGTVYVWNDAPPGAAGQAYTFPKPDDEALNWTPPADMDLAPLGGVYIRWRAVYREDTEESQLTISSKTGRFEKTNNRWKVAGDIILYVTVEKEGYRTLETTVVNPGGFLFGGEPSVAYFILVPEPGAEG